MGGPEMARNLGVVLVALLLAPAAAEAGMSKCLSREGQCMAVTVNGQKSVKVGKKTKTLLKGLKDVSHDVEFTRYELPAPIRGELDVKADRSADSGDWFGEGRRFEALAVPLGKVDLQTHQELTTADNVRVEGAAPIVTQHVLDQNRLPPGRYLLIVTLNGESNWDRQTLFFEVVE